MNKSTLLDLVDDQPQATKTVQAQKAFQTTVIQKETNLLEPAQNNFSTTVNVHQSGVFNFFDNSKPQEPVYNNIIIPVVEVLTDADTSREGKYTGLTIRAAFER